MHYFVSKDLLLWTITKNLGLRVRRGMCICCAFTVLSRARLLNMPELIKVGCVRSFAVGKDGED